MLVLNDPDTAAWVANKCDADPRISCAAIGWERDGATVCGAFYENYTGKSVTATIAIEPGSVFPKEFMRAIFEYPFNTLGCWKVLALVAESNYKSQTLVERMGFVKEAIITDYYPNGDMFVYSMNKTQCRYLEKDDG